MKKIWITVRVVRYPYAPDTKLLAGELTSYEKLESVVFDPQTKQLFLVIATLEDEKGEYHAP